MSIPQCRRLGTVHLFPNSITTNSTNVLVLRLCMVATRPTLPPWGKLGIVTSRETRILREEVVVYLCINSVCIYSSENVLLLLLYVLTRCSISPPNNCEDFADVLG